MPKNILSIEQICNLVNRDRRTLWTWSKQGKFIKPIKVNNVTLGYLESDYNAWLETISKEA